MNESKRQQECPPVTKDPADHPRGCGQGDGCDPIPTTTPPTLKPPEPCAKECDCNCPEPPIPRPTCIDDLISKYEAEIAASGATNSLKADLEDILKRAKASAQGYTHDKYHALTKAWVENDNALAELIRQVVCVVPCWRCVLECYVCSQLDQYATAEQMLTSDTAMLGVVSNIYDLQYWSARDLDAKARRLDRIIAVINAWAPDKSKANVAAAAASATLGAALEAIIGIPNNGNNNGIVPKAIKQALADLGTKTGGVVYDVFLKIIPLHLAVAPPAGSKWATKIAKAYTKFCGCDTGTPDNCCGPDVGVLSFRQRLIGPQPYLIAPHEYYSLICCLVEKRYAPATQAKTQALAAKAAIDKQIAAYTTLLAGLSGFEGAVRPQLPAAIDCCDYERGDADRPTSDQSAT